jgi:hypothetical protein
LMSDKRGETFSQKALKPIRWIRIMRTESATKWVVWKLSFYLPHNTVANPFFISARYR